MSEANSETARAKQARKRSKITSEQRRRYNWSVKAVEYRKRNRDRILLQAIWHGIIDRCTKESSGKYHRYGGRGITVCARWRESFEDFAEDMGPRPPGYTVERKDNNGPYSPDNCIWATRQAQARNRTTNSMIEHDGRSLTVAEWSEITGLSRTVIEHRIAAGWSIREALETPILKLRRKVRR